ncbi:hypothetical protein [Acetobacter sp.]|uniref:hypothetical protein n=1 Tax=Acetobacter sp. TaxID=440 RepID=UPI0039ECCD08
MSIGDGVLFGSRVGLYIVNHPLILTNALLEARTYINPDVTIGNNTIVGSGSVLTKDIPPNVIAAGVPCKVIRSGSFVDRRVFRLFEPVLRVFHRFFG